MDDITKIKRTSQTIDNLSFDESYQLSAFIPMVENEAGTAVSRQKEIATESTLQTIAGFGIPAHDYIGVAYPTATREVYTYKNGGSGGTTVATITVNYTDTTKEYVTDLTKV